MLKKSLISQRNNDIAVKLFLTQTFSNIFDDDERLRIKFQNDSLISILK